MRSILHFCVFLSAAASVSAGIIPIAATRWIRANGVGIDGTAYDVTKAPAQQFGPFTATAAGFAPLAYSNVSQTSDIRANGIEGEGFYSAYTSGYAGPNIFDSMTSANFESIFVVTFTVDKPTPFTLESYIDEGSGATVSYSLVGSTSGVVAKWEGYDPALNNNRMFMAGVLIPEIYTLQMLVGPVNVPYLPQLERDSSGNHRFNLVADVPERGATIVVFGATIALLLGMRRKMLLI